MTKTLLLFFTVFLLTCLCSKRAFTQYQIQHFTTENGMPSNGVKGLQWDESTGFLWIATEAGLVRYNGMGFKTFDVTTNPEFGSNRTVLLVRNAAGKILLCGQEGNLSLIKNNTAALYFNGSQFAKYNYSHYGALESSDTLFRQCVNNPWATVEYPTIHIKVIAFNDTASIIYNGSNLFYYSVSTKQPDLIKSTPGKIKSAFQTGRQVYYADSLDHLFAFDYYQARSREQELLDAGGEKLSLHQRNSKILWQPGMESAVLLQDGKAWIMEKKNETQLLARLIATGLPQDVLFNYAQYKKEGNYLYLGSASKGIYIIHSNRLVTKHPASNSINQSNSFYSQIELPDGNIATSDGIIIGNAFRQDDFKMGKGFLSSVYHLNDSILVFGRKDSVYQYNKNTYSRKLMFVKHMNINFTLAGSGNQLYYADHEGIGMINKNNSIDFLHRFDRKTGVNILITDMIDIGPHKLALATCEGLLGFDIQTKKLDTLLKIPSVCIRSLYREGQYIFIGTYGGGFYVMKNNVLKAMPLDVNQYLKYAHCFIKDANGFCWISSNNGLFKVKTADIIAAYDKDLPQIYYHYLGKDDGMETTEMNGGCIPCALKMKTGIFSFPTMDGLLWIDPSTNMPLPSGEIFIDKIMADGKEMEVTNRQTLLPENVKKIDLSFAINGWCKKENLYIDYQLNNDKWLPVEVTPGDLKISLSNLSYGKYKLAIRKMNGFGVNNYSYSSIAFTIATPFYHQWWFRILAVLALAGIGRLVFRWRVRQYEAKEKKLSALVDEKTMDLNLKNIQLEKNDQIKTRLISVINHDIITPLKFMHYAGKALTESKEKLPPEQQQQTISEITQTAKDMEMLSSQILNWIIYQNPNERMLKEDFDLHQLVEMVFGVLRFPAKLKNTSLQNEVPEHAVVYQYMEPLRVLIYNLVLNSINFTRQGTVKVAYSTKDNRSIVQVSDNGLGMTQDQIDNILSDDKIIASANVDNKKGTGLGYMIIKDLLKMMNGSMSVKSSKNQGTTVTVSLPLK